MASVNCPSCGAANDGGRFRCAYCGTQIGAAPPAPSVQMQPAPQPQPQTGPQFQGPFALPAQAGAGAEAGPKRKDTAALLAFFLGIFGAHNFYLDRRPRGALQLVLSSVLLGVFLMAAMRVLKPGDVRLIADTLFNGAVSFGGLVDGYMIAVAVMSIWAFIEFILILTGSYRDGAGRKPS
jgi:TM2 domain-containing membrane protein YozV